MQGTSSPWYRQGMQGGTIAESLAVPFRHGFPVIRRKTINIATSCIKLSIAILFELSN
jgi:hypothetical protein